MDVERIFSDFGWNQRKRETWEQLAIQALGIGSLFVASQGKEAKANLISKLPHGGSGAIDWSSCSTANIADVGHYLGFFEVWSKSIVRVSVVMLDAPWSLDETFREFQKRELEKHIFDQIEKKDRGFQKRYHDNVSSLILEFSCDSKKDEELYAMAYLSGKRTSVTYAKAVVARAASLLKMDAPTEYMDLAGELLISDNSERSETMGEPFSPFIEMRLERADELKEGHSPRFVPISAPPNSSRMPPLRFEATPSSVRRRDLASEIFRERTLLPAVRPTSPGHPYEEGSSSEPPTTPRVR